MQFIEQKVQSTCQKMKALCVHEIQAFKDGVTYVKSGYKQSNLPPEEGRVPYCGESLEKDSHYWFRVAFHTPPFPDCGPKADAQYLFRFYTGRNGAWDALNPQALVYLNGRMVQGLDINHTTVTLSPDTNYTADVYLYTGNASGTAGMSLMLLDKAIEHLYYDLWVALEAARCLDRNSYDYAESMRALEECVNAIDFRQTEGEVFRASVLRADTLLQQEYYQKLCGRSHAEVSCTGHTHIDVAWLWTLSQTREKAQRSFATVLQLMEEYPEYIFFSSQPQLLAFVKQEAPELFEEIKRRVADGRFELDGAAWLEHDCNLISGESMVRQLLYGKRFLKQEFGVDSRIMWLPDVFGYSAAMPQILRKSGVDKFVTSKISWSETNLFPYDTFMWQGIDGTEIFTNFITARNLPQAGDPGWFTTYNGTISPSMALGTIQRYQQKEFNRDTFIPFGFGDGGGGPTREMLETQRRMALGLPGIPNTKIRTVKEYLRRTEHNFEENTARLGRTPKWVGELYLELHRGTYTSIAKVKKNNRECEFLLQQAESLAAFAALSGAYDYPTEALDDAWKTVLLNQFHDIIPGSSIYDVYEESDQQFQKVRGTAQSIIEQAASVLAQQAVQGTGLDRRPPLKGSAPCSPAQTVQTAQDREWFWVYNPTPFDGGALVDVQGEKRYTGVIPAHGCCLSPLQPLKYSVKAQRLTLENDCYVIRFDNSGAIVSLYDKRAGREVVQPGQKANELAAFEDDPRQYDAWEITGYYRQKKYVLDAPAESTPILEGARAGLRFQKAYLSSSVVQTVYLYEDSPRIDFVTEIDWQEEHQLLKAFFPFDLHATKATYEIQFGHIERPTHENTSWDAAKFEVCAHKWADVSENGYGVSLLNDCKYGHSANGSTLALTLLKCATYPNPNADKGHHAFTYSLLPHMGDFREAGTIPEAYRLNQAFLCRPISAAGIRETDTQPFAFVSSDRENVVVETIKKACDSDDLIVRLYESHDRRDRVTLTFGFDLKAAALCDLMENELSSLAVDGRSVTFPIQNFEIVTLKVTPQL